MAWAMKGILQWMARFDTPKLLESAVAGDEASKGDLGMLYASYASAVPSSCTLRHLSARCTVRG